MAYGRVPAFTHDLRLLLQSIAEWQPSDSVRDSALELTEYSVLPRYPATNQPDFDAASRALACARLLRQAVDSCLSSGAAEPHGGDQD